MAVWSILPPTRASWRFTPAAVVGLAGVTVAIGHIEDPGFVLIVAVLVPVVAYSLYLLAPWRSQRILNPDVVTRNLVFTLVVGMAKQKNLRFLDILKRSRLRLSLLNVTRPIVQDQFAEFWKGEARPTDLTRRLEHLETVIISLEFLTVLYWVFAFVPLFGVYGYYGYYGSQVYLYFNPYGIPAFFVMVFVGFTFLIALANTRRSYSLLLRDHIPLLAVTGSSLDAAYWARKRQFVDEQRAFLEPEVSAKVASAANDRRLEARLGEVEKKWIEREAAMEVGVAQFKVLGIVDAAILSERRRSTAYAMVRAVGMTLLISTVFAGVAAYMSGGNPILVYATTFLLLAGVLISTILYGWLYSNAAEDIRHARQQRIQDAINLLYGPLESMVSDLRSRPQDSSLLAEVKSQMDRRLKERESSLALPATLSAYKGLLQPAQDRERVLAFAKAFLDDLAELRNVLPELSKGEPETRPSGA